MTLVYVFELHRPNGQCGRNSFQKRSIDKSTIEVCVIWSIFFSPSSRMAGNALDLSRNFNEQLQQWSHWERSRQGRLNDKLILRGLSEDKSNQEENLDNVVPLSQSRACHLITTWWRCKRNVCDTIVKYDVRYSRKMVKYKKKDPVCTMFHIHISAGRRGLILRENFIFCSHGQAPRTSSSDSELSKATARMPKTQSNDGRAHVQGRH